MRLLIVDDDIVNRRVLSAMLDFEGVELVEADTAEDAFRLIDEAPLDLVLMDLRMPNMDGLDATRRIRNRPGPNADVPIAIVTADASFYLREECLAVGANELINKPIRIGELHEIVGRLLALGAHRTNVLEAVSD